MCAVEAFRKEIRKSTIPTQEESAELARKREYGELVKRNMPLVVNLCHKWTKNNNDCMDLIQECSVHLWQVCHEFDPRFSSFQSFATQVIKNKLVDISRGRGRKKNEMNYFSKDLPTDLSSQDDNPVLIYGLKERHKQVGKELAKLSQIERTSVILYYWKGQTHARIAERFHLTGERIRQIIRHALTKMSGKLEVFA